jgi:TM2 domain-containing membrane protein YozV
MRSIKINKRLEAVLLILTTIVFAYFSIWKFFIGGILQFIHGKILTGTLLILLSFAVSWFNIILIVAVFALWNSYKD